MSKPVVIALSREFGSGGHVIARELSKRLDIPYYDKSILARVAEKNKLDQGELVQYEEKPANRLITRRVGVHTNSPQDAVANMQFNMIREMARSGESFISVGRCSEEILKEVSGINLITIFVTGDEDAKIARVVDRESLNWQDAAKRVRKVDKERRKYHERYCDTEWGAAENFDIVINSSRLGLDGTADVLERYVRARMAHEE